MTSYNTQKKGKPCSSNMSVPKYEFQLDFTQGVPHRFCPKYKDVAALYVQCLSQPPMDIEFRELKRGIFMIGVYNDQQKEKLQGKSLVHDWGDKRHEMKSTTIPLILQKKRAFHQNPKWVTIDKLYDSALRYATNEQLDAFFSDFGDLIIPTHDHKEAEYGFKTGKKQVKLDLKEDIERWRDVEMNVKIDTKEVTVKGRVNIYYRNQPYFCRDCKETHQEKCPKRVLQEVAEAEGEKERLSKVNTLLIGDSNLRRVNEKAFYCKTDCASGAKIGHIANSLQHVTTDEYKNVVVLAGLNNIMQDNEVDTGELDAQIKNEVNNLKTQLSKFDRAIVIGVPPAPSSQKTEKQKKQRKKINAAFQKLTKDNLKIRYVQIEQEDEDDRIGGSNWEDPQHMTEKFTKYMLGKVSDSMLDIQAGNFFIEQKPWTCSQIHRGVSNSYKYGCDSCTLTGHSKESCPGIGKKGGTKRPPSQGMSPTLQPGTKKSTY